MILTFIILAITIALFIWGKWQPDLVALLSVLALFAAGIITTQQALAGFGDSTVVMIAALFVVGEGLSPLPYEKNGDHGLNDAGTLRHIQSCR